jgi:hypothetical protein
MNNNKALGVARLFAQLKPEELAAVDELIWFWELQRNFITDYINDSV